MKALETYYNGRYFRSRLEARWAVFFDACGVKYEYEPQGYELGGGLKYLPDFLLHDVTFNHAGFSSGNDLYVEVKGKMDELSAKKIKLFAEEKPILVVYDIPLGETFQQIFESVDRAGWHSDYGITPFNFETVDSDYFTATPGIDVDGIFSLFGADSSYMQFADEKATIFAYRKARMARFERGAQILREMKNNS